MITIELSTLQPYSPSVLPIIALPFILLYVQAYLLLKYGKQTGPRLVRAALLPVGLWSIGKAWLGYRIMTPKYNIFNFAFGCAAVFYTVLLFSYSLIPTGPHRTHRTTPSLDAAHLICSSRLVGWSSGTPLAPRPYPDLPTDVAEKKFAIDQLKMAAYHYLWSDATMYAFHGLGYRGIGRPQGGSVAQAVGGWIRMMERWGWVREGLSGEKASWERWVLEVGFRWWVGGAMGFAFYQALCLGYHIMAFVGVKLLGNPSSEWPRLMNQPWRSTSLLEFWGKRWHQIFRQAFTVPTRLVPKKYRSLVAPFFAFFISAAMHEFGTLTLVGHTSPNWAVAKSFILMACGMTCEILFRRITGKRVQGPVGWVWTWVYFTTATMGLVDTWLTMGIAGGKPIPTPVSLSDQLVEPLRKRYLEKLMG